MKYHMKKKPSILSLILVLSWIHSGYAYASITETYHEAVKHQFKPSSQTLSCPSAQFYTIRGLLGVFSLGMIHLADRIEKETGIPTQSLSFIDAKPLSNYLIKRYQSPSNPCKTPIVLIGHSLGADADIVVAKELNKAHVPVALIIDLDHTHSQTVPSNVETIYNVSSGEHKHMPWGSRLITEDSHTKMIRVNLVKDNGITKVHHFNISWLPQVHDYVIQIIKTEILEIPKKMPSA